MNPAVFMAVSAVGGALSAGAQVMAGNAAARTGRYNQQVAEREAAQMDQQATQEVAAASFSSERIAKRAKEILAEQRAASAKGGGSSQDATVVALERETIKNASLDQLLTMAEAQERAQQIRHGADVRRSEGAYARAMGKQQKKAAYISAGATLLSTAANSWQMAYGSSGETAKAAGAP